MEYFEKRNLYATITENGRNHEKSKQIILLTKIGPFPLSHIIIIFLLFQITIIMMTFVMIITSYDEVDYGGSSMVTEMFLFLKNC